MSVYKAMVAVMGLVSTLLAPLGVNVTRDSNSMWTEELAMVWLVVCVLCCFLFSPFSLPLTVPPCLCHPLLPPSLPLSLPPSSLPPPSLLPPSLPPPLDINECAIDADNCDQVCVDTDGSFTCDCNANFMLDANGITCTGKCLYVSLSVCLSTLPSPSYQLVQYVRMYVCMYV